MSGFADDERSSEDKISSLEVVNTTETDQTRTSDGTARDESVEDQGESNITSALTESQGRSEDGASFVSTSLTGTKVIGTKKKTPGKKPPKNHFESKFCPESSEVSCDDLVIVLEERRFLKVLEDVVRELVEKLVTEKLSNKGSASSQRQSVQSKPGGKKTDVKKSFDKKIKIAADSQRTGEETAPETVESAQSEPINAETESSVTQPGQQDTQPGQPSESTQEGAASGSSQGGATQPKSKSRKSGASTAKGSSAKHSGAEQETAEAQEDKERIEPVCYFKSKSSKAKKTPKPEREHYYRDVTCKTICKTYMRLSPEDQREKNLKIANSLFSATFCLLMNKFKKQDSLADKIGIALCGPRQCFEQCSTQEQIDAYNAQPRITTKSVFPKLKSGRSSKKSIGLSSQHSSTCIKHCREATLSAIPTPTILPKL